MSLPIEVVEARDKGKCILFVGRRASLEAVTAQDGTYPAEKKLARLLAGKKMDFQDALAGAYRRLGASGVGQEMAVHLACEKTEPGPFHTAAVQHFSLVFTTCQDDLLERAAKASGLDFEVYYRGDPIPVPDPEKLQIYKVWGCFSRPETLVFRPEDFEERPIEDNLRKSLRKLLVRNVVFFVGYRPDEVEFSWVYEELESGFGGKLPRIHLAVAQGRISDYYWQKWVWKGLLLFTAGPADVMRQLEATFDE